jgi:hypothetical protein
VAADFGFDLHQFFSWAKAQTAAEKKAQHWLPISPPALETEGGAMKSSATRKRRTRPATVPG